MRMEEASLSSSRTMAESEITAMKETLRAQQQLLQLLYTELDEEREASATAASEALDMIHRLQGEKATVKMEARQYERMAEERLEHAETTLEIFEELMFQKDMEIGNLENQVQAYKRKLVSLGCDPNLTEFELQENYINNDSNNNSDDDSVRRLISLPPLPVNKNSFRGARKRERSPSPYHHHHHHTDMVQTIEEKKTEKKPVQQGADFAKSPGESSHETLDSYWEQIRKLDEKVREISDYKEKEGIKGPNLRGRRHRSCSLYRSRSRTISTSISPRQGVHHEIKQQQQQNREAITDPSCSVNVHDVFEVPQPGDDENNYRVNNKHGKNRIERLRRTDSDNRLTKPDPEVPEEKAEALSRYDSGKLMSLLSMNMDTNAHSPNGGNNNNKITCMFGRKMEGASVEYCNGEAEFHLLSKRMERLENERERVSSREEIIHEGDGREQLRLLKEILSQLKSMREETMSRSLKAKKSPPKDDGGLLDRLKEAMLHCWI